MKKEIAKEDLGKEENVAETANKITEGVIWK